MEKMRQKSFKTSLHHKEAPKEKKKSEKVNALYIGEGFKPRPFPLQNVSSKVVHLDLATF